MKSEFVKFCATLLFILFSVQQTYAHEVECDCYMEYSNIETEAKVYADQNSKDASLTEFTPEQKSDIQEATNLIADGMAEG